MQNLEGELKFVWKVNRRNAEWRCDRLVKIVGFSIHQISGLTFKHFCIISSQF
jgi:hypothetical protein